jgi:hypothetical protein
MPLSHNGQRARPGALSANDEPRGDLAGERDHFANGTDCNGLQAPYRHHVDCPRRRPKTIEELHAGAEYVELFDRRFPGRMARGARP